MTLSRRDALRTAFRAAGAAAAGAVLAACRSARTAGGPPPTRASASPVVLTVLPSQSWPTAIGPALWELLYGALQPFLRRHRGVEVRLFANQGYQGATQAAMLAGAGPDVFSDWIMPPFVENDLMLDLAPFIKRDNLDLGIFPPGEMSFFREAALFSPSNPHGLYAVPAYLHTEAYAVNLTLLDALGLKYPQPDWTIKEWTALWEAATVRPTGGKRQRYGTDLDWGGYDYSYDMITPYVLWGYGGDYVNPRDPTRCDLTSPGALACGRHVFDLIWSGVAMVGSGTFINGDVVCTHNTCTCGAQLTEAQQWRGFKWDYFEDPVWPKRRSSYAASDFYGIWSGTKHREAAWALLKWMAFEPDWQRIVMKTALAGPNQARLWEEWAAIVRAFAPPLRDKNLEAFSRPVLRGEPYFGHVFRYAEAQVKAIVANYSGQLLSRRMTVDEAFTHMAAEIDAAQKAGAASAGAQARAAAAFAHEVAAARRAKGVVTFPRPPRNGAGVPAVDAPQYVRLGRARDGQLDVTLTGVGGGVAGASDGMTFACQTYVQSRGSFRCRLASIAAVSGQGLQDGAKIGLMARSDLSDAAGEIGIEVAMGRGVHMHTRPFAGTALGDHRPPSDRNPSGLLGKDVILLDDGRPARNYLRRPVWLRLDFDVNTWVAYTSLDGRRWTQAFDPVGMGFVGCWVGLFATAHGGNDVRAVFDHLQGLKPSTFVTVGVPTG